MIVKVRGLLFLVPFVLLSASALGAQTPAAGTPLAKTLDIYVIDTEGGNSVLFVAPSGQTVLIDAGNPGERDLDRIMATIADAGVSRIDYLLLTHYHIDHIGGVLELAKRVPILNYVDHGPTVEPNEQVRGFQQAYAGLYGKARHTVAKPGDKLAIDGLDWEIVSAAGKVLDGPLAGAGQRNASCAETELPAAQDVNENDESVGSVVTYGEFRAVHLGDLLIKQELELMCPVNRIGTTDLYITSHHGLALSGSAALVHALRPRVAVMNNGTRKGGAVQTFQILRSSPGLEDLWQLHWSYHAGTEYNSPGLFIANVDSPAVIASVLTASSGGAPHTGAAYLIRISARPDGVFTVTNTRNNFSKTYTSGN